MNQIQNGWFSEIGSLWPGQAMSLQVEEVLFQGKSDFQDVLAFKSTSYGNVLVLDGVIQATERDEFSYQEMLAHVALCAHPSPKSVLVIGGGDGGVLREIAKHDCVEKITICEIDKMVIDTAKQYLPGMARGFDDPRVTVFIGDGCAYMQARKGEFDVIIVDSSDPVGPAQTLFEKPFYQYMHDALSANGIACTQAENMWLHLDLIKNLVVFSKQLFAHAEYAYTMIPTYPGGQIGFLLCSKGDSCKTPRRSLPSDKVNYYNAAIHAASFVLPEFARRVLDTVDKS
eukprot:TRINITY_DN4619_c0_g2_i2.p1 TRINITY_DN4619_c0_g2~~TRINITY_DN4619_c0_g2_i2.p1  ORF type:complete len:286 (+),score=87.13 TRINITY_DN4619_c0_g2_i2:108-965(+)